MKKENLKLYSIKYHPNHRYPIGNQSEKSMTGPEDMYYDGRKIDNDTNHIESYT